MDLFHIQAHLCRVFWSAERYSPRPRAASQLQTTIQTPTREDQMSEADAVHSFLNTTVMFEYKKKSHHESPTHTFSITQAENVEDERHYIIGWRLYLLTFRFSCTEVNQDSIHEVNVLQSVSKSNIVNSRDYYRQYLTRQYCRCFAQTRPKWLGCHLLTPDLHWYTFPHSPEVQS